MIKGSLIIMSYDDCIGWKVWLSFLAALLLYIMPWPNYITMFRPNWVLLILIYWNVSRPHNISIGTSFSVGFILDLTVGSILGVRALSMSITTYLVGLQNQLLRDLVIWQQSVIVITLSLLVEVINFFSECLFADISFNTEVLWSSFSNGIIWPWVLFLMRRLCQ